MTLLRSHRSLEIPLIDIVAIDEPYGDVRHSNGSESGVDMGDCFATEISPDVSPAARMPKQCY